MSTQKLNECSKCVQTFGEILFIGYMHTISVQKDIMSMIFVLFMVIFEIFWQHFTSSRLLYGPFSQNFQGDHIIFVPLELSEISRTLFICKLENELFVNPILQAISAGAELVLCIGMCMTMINRVNPPGLPSKT